MDNLEDFLKMSYNDQISYWLGQMFIAIGKGQARECISQIADFHLRVGFDRGKQAEKQNPS